MSTRSDNFDGTGQIENLGIEAAKKYAIENNIPYADADKSQDYYGIDCYMNGKPTDVKGTVLLHIGRVNRIDKFYVRHPFSTETQATQIFVCEMNEFHTKVIGTRFYGDLDTYLLHNYFYNERGLKIVRQYLTSFNGKHYSQAGFKSVESMLYTMKEKIKPHLHEYFPIAHPKTVYCNFNDLRIYKNGQEGWNFFICLFQDHKRYPNPQF